MFLRPSSPLVNPIFLSFFFFSSLSFPQFPFVWLRDKSQSQHKHISLGFIYFFPHAMLYSKGEKKDINYRTSHHQLLPGKLPTRPPFISLPPFLSTHYSLTSLPLQPSLPHPLPSCVAAWWPPSSPVTQVTRCFVFTGVFACRKFP